PHGVGRGERPLHHDAAGGLRGRARDRSARRGTHRAAVHPGASRGGLPRAVAGAALVRGIGRCDGGSGGVKRARAEILSTRRLGAYQSLTLVAPEIAERARPGQFVAAAMPEDRNFLLRRHLTIHQSSRRGGWAGTLEFVVEPGAGPGTTWLSELRAHGSIDIIGPLGKAFSYPKRLTNCLLVGHGRSVAGLYFLGQELVARGKRVDMVIGGSTMDTIFKPIEAKRLSQLVTVVTDDGTLGERGSVVDALPEAVARGGAQVVYAAGAPALLRAVSALCRDRKLPAQVAVEERMGC